MKFLDLLFSPTVPPDVLDGSTTFHIRPIRFFPHQIIAPCGPFSLPSELLSSGDFSFNGLTFTIDNIRQSFIDNGLIEVNGNQIIFLPEKVKEMRANNKNPLCIPLDFSREHGGVQKLHGVWPEYGSSEKAHKLLINYNAPDLVPDIPAIILASGKTNKANFPEPFASAKEISVRDGYCSVYDVINSFTAVSLPTTATARYHVLVRYSEGNYDILALNGPDAKNYNVIDPAGTVICELSKLARRK